MANVTNVRSKQTNEGAMSVKTNASKAKDNSEVIKNHHKQAFEHISKALKIDEDDTGLFLVICMSYL